MKNEEIHLKVILPINKTGNESTSLKKANKYFNAKKYDRAL